MPAKKPLHLRAGEIPPGLLRYRQLVPDWPDFLAALQRPLLPALWLNTLRHPAGDVREFCGLDPAGVQRLPWWDLALRLPSGARPGKWPGWTLGLFHIQEEVSMLPVMLLDPRPGEMVLDLCAAPGNKSLQAAVLMRNRGTVLANDIDPMRLRGLKMNAARLGVLNISTTVGDGRSFSGERNLWDRVIVDVPCSCEGTARKTAGVFAHGYQPGVPFQRGVQTAVLKRAVNLCRPGGRIVYSTCTFRPEENEEVVDQVLQDGRVRMLPARLPGWKTSPGLQMAGERALHSDLPKALRIWPHQNDSGGFFIALLEKLP